MSLEVAKVSPQDVTAIADYGGDHTTGLYATVVKKLNLQQQYMTVIVNLTADENLIKLTVSDGIRPYNPGEQYESDISYSKRKIRVGSVKKEILIDAKKFKRTWLSKQLMPGAHVKEIPFAQFTWMEIMKKFASEILSGLVWNGRHEDDFAEYDNGTVYNAGDLVVVSEATGKDEYYICTDTTTAGEDPAGTPAKWDNITKNAATDGFKILIDNLITGGFSETTIGVIDNSAVHALPSFRTLARALDDAVWEDEDIQIVQYCSRNQMDLLQDDIEDKLSKYTVYDVSEAGERVVVPNAMYLPGTNKRVIVVAVSWLSGSNRIITTYSGNLHFGCNLLSDLNEISTVAKLWTVGAGLLFDLGFQIADVDPKVFVLNDQE